MPKCWLMKTEPDVFSWDDLMRSGQSSWEGVRNYQARNFMRDDFAIGDLVLFYHSSCAEPGIVGIAEVASPAYPDPTALDPSSKYFDEISAKQGTSRWVMVDIKPIHGFRRVARLSEIRNCKELASMRLLQRGQRLSIQPVTEEEFLTIRRMWG